MPATTKVGSVTLQRYEELVAQDRKLVLDESKIQFKIGDDALEIAPLTEWGGSLPASSEGPGVRETLEMFAEDVGLSYSQVRTYRYTSHRWPCEHRAEGVPFEIHRILEKLEDRFERILKPPKHPRHGKLQWTGDAAKRQVGWQVDTPQSVQEKVEAIHDLASDEQVAARVATDFLRRPPSPSGPQATTRPGTFSTRRRTTGGPRSKTAPGRAARGQVGCALRRCCATDSWSPRRVRRHACDRSARAAAPRRRWWRSWSEECRRAAPGRHQSPFGARLDALAPRSAR